MKRTLRSSSSNEFSRQNMSSESNPTKRRKVIMAKPKKAWPKASLPVEIFTLIVSYLPRSNIQNLRLVNKEFDRKVSEALFRTVVVAFRPEIYGITPEPVSSNEALQGAIMLQDKGMRVFQGFGRWIQKFAMSFEIDHNRLANPPIKSDQEAITTFWGIYRWPFKVYNRYSQLEGLEQTADETRTMAKALMFVQNAKELGLSIDGGLGWLPGPDINSRVAARGARLAVFGASRFVPEPPPRARGRGKTPSSAVRAELHNTSLGQYERILSEAGYNGGDLEPAVRMLLRTEELGVLPPQPVPIADVPAWNNIVTAPAPLTVREAWRRRRLNTSTNASNTTLGDPPLSLVDTSTGDWDDGSSVDSQQAYQAPKSEAVLLKPNDLNNAQREMLLEMEWAQNAFMQSWAIAILDNHKTFQNIKKLTIARLPSRHVLILRREDFWDSLSGLDTLSLAVIPDWREVKKEATSYVEDNRLAPSKAVTAVYDLLSQQISRRENIKTLHFEWLGGGEYAPGLFTRNQHILAAPVVQEAMHMVHRAEQHTVLTLPHIEHLSLKNCYLSPHVSIQLLYPMREAALKSLNLDSVSLTASVPHNAAPNPAPAAGHGNGNGNGNAQNVVPAAHALGAHLMNNFLGGAVIGVQPNAPAQPPVVPAANQAPNTNWLTHIRPGSWANVIDHITPSTTLAAIRYSKDIGSEPTPKPATKLSKLVFTSCGYVRLPLDFDQTALENPVAQHQPAGILKRISDIDNVMMKPQDPTLAVIVNHINDTETATLENAWNMEVGWRALRPELLADAHLDGCMNAGLGRFDGLIEVARTPNSLSRLY